MSQIGAQQDMYSREYKAPGANVNLPGGGEPDMYSREYVGSGIVKKQRTDKPVAGKDVFKKSSAESSVKVREPDVYTREYITTGVTRNTALDYTGQVGEQNMYSREYGRSVVKGKKTEEKVVSKQKAEHPSVMNGPVDKKEEKKEIQLKVEPQPSIFDKISKFFHGIFG
ncbi:MAG: hypothetical protein Q7J09_05235 [Methanocalculus sp.]|uniref:hypothetical protein n=1 Tax=Methanocalculus sp. TaxID=2004547 RepID=UPI00271C58AE|nr:hypothetical protein [Methanocalculus sp.]MDO9539389.1 hypothetical protein [Methanocalculus sp.]